ncbi:MAG: hypothetical protein KatS3mg105_4156 [Gemmatales bacterium]|nr:MAG: hypothetical protein KatS3mg105_4156 [Gemmatales bacterium]
MFSMPVLVFVSYLVAHFAFYVFIARRNAWLRSEKAIFAYHFFPACVVAILYLLFAMYDDKWNVFVFVISLQGIYSLSFLELWSLTQGSYSLSILEAIERNAAASAIDNLSTIGEQKRAARLENLQNLGFVRLRDGKYQLTPWGSVAAWCCVLLTSLSNVSEGN